MWRKTVFILFIAIGTITIPVNARSIHDKIPYSTGKENSYDWILYLSISVIGIILNGISLNLLLTEVDSTRMSMYNYLFALYSIDLVFAVVEVAIQSMNFSENTIYGGNFQCQLMSAVEITFFFWSVAIIMLISYATERKLCANIKFTNLQIFYFVILSGMYSAFVGFGAAYLPYGGYFVEASGNERMY